MARQSADDERDADVLEEKSVTATFRVATRFQKMGALRRNPAREFSALLSGHQNSKMGA
jgi:hypothetical protein